MNEAMHLMAGFKDIKSEFRTKLRIAKSAEELALWFTFENGILYVHDYEEHKTCMAIAIKSESKNNTWVVRLKKDSHGAKLTLKATSNHLEAPDDYLNNRYKLSGQMPFVLLKR